MSADYLVLMCETIEELINKLRKVMVVFHSRGLKVSFGKTEVMASGDIT